MRSSFSIAQDINKLLIDDNLRDDSRARMVLSTTEDFEHGCRTSLTFDCFCSLYLQHSSMYERESTTHKSGNGERRMSIHGAVLSGYTTLSKGYTSHQAMQSQGGQNVTYNHANSCGVPLHQRVDTSKSLQAHLDATDQRQVSSYAVSPHRHVYSYGGGTFGGATSLSTTQVGQGGPAHAGRSVYRPYVPGDRAAIQFC
jgi:hypothetical protein